MELEELHVLERDSLAPDDADAVARQGVGVGRGLEHLAEPTGRKDYGGRIEHVDVTGRQFVRDDTARARRALFFGQDEVEDVELVVELDTELGAVLEEGLQNHVPGAVGGVARATDGCFSVVTRMATKSTLVDLAVRRAVERETHVLEIDDRVDCFAREDLGSILVNEVVATLDGVERVPLPRVFFDVGQCRGHSALRRSRVRTRRVQLGDDRRLCVGGRFDGRAHSCATRAHNDNVVFVMMNRGHGLTPYR